MNKKRLTGDVIVTLMAFVAAAIYLYLQAPYRIGFKEQVSIFLWSPDRVAWYLSNPAVVASVAGDWLTQFYMSNAVGVTVTLLLMVILWLGIVRVITLAGAGNYKYMLAFLPVVISGWFMTWPNYPVSALTGFIIAIWAACAISHIENVKFRAVAIGLGMPVIFILAGGHALSFAVASLFIGKRNLKANLIAFVLGFGALLLAGRLYNLTLIQTLVFPVTPGYIVPDNKILMLLPLSVVVVLALSVWLNNKVSYAIVLVVTLGVLSLFKDVDMEFSFKIGTLAYRSEWKEVRSLANKHLDSRFGLYYRNLSYAREGSLPDVLLSCRQTMASEGLFLSTTQGDGYLSMFYFTDALLEMGDLSQATDCALLGQTIMPGYYSTRMLRRLAEISVTAGDYTVASKYLDILARTRNHKAWARNLMDCIAKDSIPDDYLILRTRTSTQDHFFLQGDIQSSLKLIAEDRPLNKVAIDYLLCSYLLDKNLNTFTGLYEKYYLGALDQIYRVPELYQEALLVNVNSDESLRETVERYKISRAVTEKYMNLLNAQASSGNPSAITRESEGTYWNYIMSVRLNNRNQQ